MEGSGGQNKGGGGGSGPWKCSCGWKNNERNTQCGGTSSSHGCNMVRPSGDETKGSGNSGGGGNRNNSKGNDQHVARGPDAQQQYGGGKGGQQGSNHGRKGKGGNTAGNHGNTQGGGPKGGNTQGGGNHGGKGHAGGKGKRVSNHNKQGGGKGAGGGKGKQSRFPEHWSEQYVQALLVEGALLSGKLRINSKRTQESYVNIEGVPHDCFIDSYVNRNRAFSGDKVAIRLLGRREWRPRDGGDVDLSGLPENETPAELLAHAQKGDLQAQAVVVAIIEAKRDTVYIGTLIPFGGNANFVPSDTAVTRFFISGAECPAGFAEDKKMYSCVFQSWGSNDHLPKGKLDDFVGEFGDIESETEALMIRHEVDAAPFDEAILLQLRERYPEGWQIPEEEIANRRDLRSECIFAIDPPTAKDLDDALQCERLPNGNFKVGVHIADVSFFIEPNELLDEAAAARATSVYLCDRVIPMLPSRLCEDLCSLNPDVDRCAFSAIWELTPDGEILDEWFGRTVIRSCWKGSYPFAQKVINGEEAPMSGCDITNGYSAADCEQVIKDLWSIAKTRRQRRVDGGALTALSQVKLMFDLDENRQPTGRFGNYMTSEANHLVEEFMLMANQQVAAFIATQFPQIAVLRNHEEPLQHGLEEVALFCEKNGIPMDTSSSKALEDSLNAGGIEDFHPHARRILSHMLTKPMQQANYFCTGDQPEDNWGHFALAMARYTHFTSPIRRYPDLMVHRLLQQAINLAAAQSPADRVRAQLLATCQAAAIRDADKYCDEPESERALAAIQTNMDKRQEALSGACVNCNAKKTNARKASEASTYVFLAVTLRTCPLEVEGVVLALGASYLNIIAVGFDIEAKCYLDDCALLESHTFDDKSKSLALKWKACATRPEPGAAPEDGPMEVEVKQLSVVKVLLYTKENVVPLQIAMRLVPSQPREDGREEFEV